MTREIFSAGRAFEDFKVGDVIVHRLGRTVTYQDNLYYTHTLLNTSPIHFDKEYMEDTVFKQPLLVMTMTLAMAYGITSDIFRNVYRELGIRNLRFHNPVFDGDTLHVITRVLDVKEDPDNKDAGIVVVKHEVYKDRFRKLVCEFTREVMVFKRRVIEEWYNELVGGESKR
ncbi:MAG: MaoC family dehydratase [Desulfurococcales archaeon]|nr:MaoC family dehydratase [Desulfurococcales archaeon]